MSRTLGIIPAYAGNTFAHLRTAGVAGDHPRVCGEHVRRVRYPHGRRGSSPRMRGTRLSLRAGRGHHGIIPAYAGNTSSAAPKGFFNRDHPRVCGEHARFDAFGTLSAGSSPRMRGTPKRHVTICGGIGIIPAYAGNTSNCSLNPATSWDHPRVCGEHNGANDATLFKVGSSPRMRGTLRSSRPRWAVAGIIPAYAGNTAVCNGLSAANRDHPRVCGEHYTPIIAAYNLMGSSPRMRGTLGGAVLVDDLAGIIPAYAGNTSTGTGVALSRRDHPRVCGEHREPLEYVVYPAGSSPRMRGTPSMWSWCSSPLMDHPRVCGEHWQQSGLRRHALGSSPRMRGTRFGGLAVLRLHGIIPAYAGNTSLASGPSIEAGDHPRVCGEHRGQLFRISIWRGSSPRMRGTHVPAMPARLPVGIIPAYAGNTTPPAVNAFRSRDHPRVCGEHLNGVGPLDLNLGSSPRMRGTRDDRRTARRNRGIIPAYAGNTVPAAAADSHHRDHPRVCGEHAGCPVFASMKSGSSPRMRGTLTA